MIVLFQEQYAANCTDSKFSQCSASILHSLQRKPCNRLKINFFSIRRRQFSLTYSAMGSTVTSNFSATLDRIQLSNVHFFCFLMRIMRWKNFWAHLPFWAILGLFGQFFRFSFFLIYAFLTITLLLHYSFESTCQDL